MLQPTFRSRTSVLRRTHQRWPLLSASLGCLCIQGLLVSLILGLEILVEPDRARPGDSGGLVAVGTDAGHGRL
jgi:hypothetical protein